MMYSIPEDLPQGTAKKTLKLPFLRIKEANRQAPARNLAQFGLVPPDL